MADRRSKFLSFVLRHDPAHVGITFDDAGWTDVAALLDGCASRGIVITRAELEQIVATNNKQRFALSPDGLRIRANQGHSVEVELDLPRAEPPATLYHGTIAASVEGIREHGLVRGARHHVHLSADVETATKVGGRRGRPVVLVVRAGEMTEHAFLLSANGVWLVDHVPPAFIEFPAQPSAGGGNRSMKVTIAKTTLAACEAGFYTNARGARAELADAIAAARAGTQMLDWGNVRLESPVRRHATTAIHVTGESTLSALARLGAAPGHLGCLNFASAKNPGGGFLGGAQAQEESLARSSALYLCQTAHPDFYARNRAHRSVLYTDLALYSPAVPFFRDDDGGWLDAPVLASVITSPAPNAGALRQQGRFDAAAVEAALRKRAAIVFAIAAHHAIDRLVLGAWGAGVFGNDPRMVAAAFSDLCRGEYAGVFAEIVFAILGDRDSSANHRAFVDVFG